ncbi:hypothetical protein IEO21_03005 [Rhodonia placenta]|uniref:Uracil-DNA glycosylase-like domain-containing protein n=1 Tax=Rhodonia placenta TaxID=104341 RepID=A0A8H7P6K2_9APHY|nr:hypothetical protein IEO21_03005 [Postia placenta]
MSATQDQSDAELESFRTALASFAFVSPAGPRRSPRNRNTPETLNVSEDKDVLPVFSESTLYVPARKKVAAALKPRAGKQTVKEEIIGDLIPQEAKALIKTIGKRGYAPPETYAHLEPLEDHLKEELDSRITSGDVFTDRVRLQIITTVYRAGDEPLFADLTPANECLDPSEDHTLPERFNLGLTNLVHRPSAEVCKTSPEGHYHVTAPQAGELNTNEFTAGVPELLEKIARLRPRIVCFVGKGIWDAFERTARIQIAQASSPTAAPALSTPQVSEGGRTLPQKRERVSGVARNRKRATTKSEFAWDIQRYKVVHSAECT